MRDLYKTANNFKLKAPVFNSSDPPRMPTLKEQSKGMVIDENMWIWNTQNRLKEKFNNAMNPALEWLNQLQAFAQEIELNPADYITTN